MAIKFLSTVAVDTNVLYVDAAANKVGIGTTSPSQKLHVDGSARVTGAYYDSGNAPGTANQLLASTATGTAWIDPSTIVAEAATLVVIACKNTSGATIAQGTPVYQTGTVGATATIEIAPADALISANKLPAIGLLQTALNNNGFGNVVITGELTNFTTDPIDGLTPTVGDKVFVKSGGGLTLTKPTGEGNGIQNMGLVGKVSGGNAGSITVSSIMRTNDVPNLPEGRIWVGDGNTIVSDTVYVDEPNNRVGIGTTSPNESLHIEASDPRIKIVDTDGTNWESEVFTQGGALKLQARNGTNFGNISFQGDNGTTQSEYARFNSVGNFGIGTTSPSERLAVNGNASISGGIYVGGVNSFIWNNTANSNLRFGANGSEKMRITSSGNVGIGTTNPNSILHITGANPEFILEDTTNLNRCRIKNNDGNLRFEADYNSQMGNSRHQFFIDGSEKLRINTDGNVGIGTTSPGYKLHNTGTSRLEGRVTLGGNVNNFIQGNGSSLEFKSNGDYFFNKGASTQLTILSNGNVGIGTTSPSEKLVVDNGNIHVNTPSTNALGNGLRLNRPGSYYAGIEIATNDTVDWSIGANSSGFGIYENGLGATTRIIIKDGGNVGIGTTNPQSRLHIVDANPTLILEDTSNPNKNKIENVDGNMRYHADYGSDMGNSRHIFFIDNSEKLRIDTNGNVGIGTTSPGTKLYVDGGESTFNRGNSAGTIATFRGQNAVKAVIGTATSYFTGNVGIGTTSPGEKLEVSGGHLKITNSGNTNLYINANNAGSDATIFFEEQDSVKAKIQHDASNDSMLFTDGAYTDTLTLKGGNVGIGTTSPTQLLDVAGADAEIVINDSNDAPALRFRGSGVTSAMVEVNSAKDMFFKTGGVAEQMRITSAGNVGIGTTSPSSKLNVSGGDINISTSLPSVGSLYNKLNFWGTTAGQGVGASIGAYRGNNYVSGGLIFETGELTTSERMRITPTGNVGIGTTSPGAKLHIEASDPRIKIVDADGTNWESEVFTQGGALKLQARNGTNFGNISFQGDNGTTQSEYARFNSVGNFGIGTASPSERLAVNGNASISGGIYVGGVNSFIWNNTANSNLRFAANGSEKMRIASSGNVGIGVTTPRAKLDVAGGVKVANDTDTATADKEGTLRYRLAPDVPKSQSMVDMCMKTGPSSYAWVNIVTNTWSN